MFYYINNIKLGQVGRIVRSSIILKVGYSIKSRIESFWRRKVTDKEGIRSSQFITALFPFKPWTNNLKLQQNNIKGRLTIIGTMFARISCSYCLLCVTINNTLLSSFHSCALIFINYTQRNFTHYSVTFNTSCLTAFLNYFTQPKFLRV